MTSTAAIEGQPATCVQVGSREDLVDVFQENRDRLLRLISMRLDRRLAGRVDPSDILQDTFLRANAALDEFHRLSGMPIYNWLQLQAQFAVGDCHRTHLGTLKRAAGVEHRATNKSQVDALAELAEPMISPASQIANAERAEKIRGMITDLAKADREILVLRHAEEMTITEAAAELRIRADAAKERHLRAVCRLQKLCDGLNSSGTR